MPAKNTPKWLDIKNRLRDFDRDGLIGLVKDLFDASAETRAFLGARFMAQEDAKVALEPYRQRVIEPFYPRRGGFGSLKFTDARKAIREYRKATGDLQGALELMLTFVETGTRFTMEFGDIDEPFYNSLESMLDEFARHLQTPDGAELYYYFEDRLQQLVRHVYGIGWGYGDFVRGTVEEIKTYPR